MCVYTPNLKKRKRKKKYKRYNPKTIKVRISMDVSFLENQLYFNQNYEIFVPLPSHFFFETTDTPKIIVLNINLPLLSINVPQTKGEMLQNDYNNPTSEILVYTRRNTHHKSKDQSTILVRAQS